MYQYITTHGQAHSALSLSELGTKQSKLLGEKLKSLEFHGIILSSPDPCAMESSKIVADITDTEIIPFEPLNKASDSEDSESVKLRVIRGYKEVIEKYPDTEILFMAHHDTCEALINIFTSARGNNTRQYDCALSTVENQRQLKISPVLYDTSFIPYEMTTLGDKMREEFDIEYMHSDYIGELQIPDLSSLTGERILHIGDTESQFYPYYRRLIELVKPDIILHTGDMSDEVKIGRMPEVMYEYKVKTREFLKILQASGARVIIAIGNHDIPQVIESFAPDVELYERASEVILSGVPCRIGHEITRMVFDKKYCMYGHGMTYETWRHSLNIPGEACRFNVIFGSYVYDLANDRFVRISRPDDYAFE